MQTYIHTPAINYHESSTFYTKLNFQEILGTPKVFTDGKFLIEINTDKHARIGIKTINKSWKDEIGLLPENHPSFKIENGYLIRDNNSVWIYLIEGDDIEIEQKKENAVSYLGNFMGISVETTSFEASIIFWKILGFVQVSGSADQGWIVLANSDGFAVSFMLPLSCPHSFTTPSMTFFNGENNLKNIAKIKSANIPIKEEITHFNSNNIVDNVIIQDPAGYGIFVFND